MMRNRWTAGGLLAAALACAFATPPGLALDDKPPELVASTEARSPEEELRGFRLPPGFEIQLVAAEPEIDKPMNLAFDDRGRLWVTSTLEYPYPAAEGTKPRDRVVILDDFAPNGRARKATTFADGLNIPIGLFPIGRGDSAIVHGIPAIRRLTDTDGDGKADKSEELYSSYGFRDTHGMTNAFTRGFDGWIYACHGFNNDSTVKGGDGRAITMQSGNVYRMKADGSHLEYVTHGQVNPFGLAFDAWGNLFSADCHTRPIYNLLPGAWYPSFGKPHDGLGFGPEMMQHDHGSTGIAGIVRYTADQFPTEYQGSVFIGNVVTSRVNRDRLEWTGASPRAVPEADFVISDDPWFRPVDIELGPDGALYIADFYNRIIGHYEVPLTHPGRDRSRGRIWRIVHTGKAAKAPRSDWTAATTEQLIGDLSHPNLTVRMKASDNLVERGASAIEPLRTACEASDPIVRLHALWVLHRLGALELERLEPAAGSSDAIVRTHVQQILGERGAWGSTEAKLAEAGLADTDPFVRKAAARAIALHPAFERIAPLLALLAKTDAADSHLRHVVRMAIRDQLVDDAVWPRVASSPWSENDRRLLADVALGVPSPRAARFVAERLPELRERVVEAVHHAVRHGDAETERVIVESIAAKRVAAPAGETLKAMARGAQERGRALGPDALRAAGELAGSLLASSDRNSMLQGIELAEALRSPGLRGPLAKLVRNPSLGERERTAAIRALTAVDPRGAISELESVVVDASAPIETREQAAGALNGTGAPEAREALVRALPTAPGRLQTSIAIALASTAPGGESLLATVAAGKASARLLQERAVEVRLGLLNLPNGKERLAKLLVGLPPTDSKLQGLLQARRTSFAAAKVDLTAGEALFAKHCAACHQIGGKGARIGPQLDGVGVRGVDRLLEDVLDPNRNVDQAFRMTSLALANGEVVAGLLLREEGEVLILADSQGKEVRVPKASVEERTVSQLSPMPANLSDQVGEADFAHLLGFLLSRRPPAP